MKRFRLISGESRGVPDADKFNWSACILCQDTSKSEKLQCPADSKRGDVGAGYESLAINLLRFHELGELPAYVCISALDDGYGIASTLLNRRAKWHKTCRDCFNSTKLERLEKRKAVSSASSCNVDTAFESELTPHCSWTEEPVQRLTRSVLSTSHDMADKICFFCEQIKHNDKLHEVRTLQLDAHVRHCANVLQDTKLLAKLSNGDMVAIEAKYHVSCLTALYNQSRAAEKECGYDQLASVHGLAFAQLVEYTDEVQGDPVTAPVFKLAELAKMYESRLKQLGVQIDARINTTKLKERLLSHFPTMKAQTSGKQVLLVFDNDIGNALSSVCQHDSDVEGMHLAKAAQIIRRDIFNSLVDSSCKEFSGSFAPNCQESAVPESLLALVEMLLDGPSIEDQSNVCRLPAALSISQLIVYNSVKHTRSGTKRGMKTRHSVSQETPLPLYLAMMLHAETRKRELIDKLFSFGLCVSYDRLLQISASVANTAGKLYDLSCGLSPPTLRRGLFTTAAVDNIDHNPSSTTACESFHGTGISLTQHRVFATDGHIIGHDSIVSTSTCRTKTINPLPFTYTHVPPVKSLQKDITVPVVDFSGAVSDDLAAKSLSDDYRWLDHVMHAVDVGLTVEANSCISWSAYHANRQSAVIQATSIDCLLPLFHDNAHSVAMICHAMTIIRNAVNCLNPGQTPVVTLDQPLYALAKQVQWNWPAQFGEQHFVVLLGGLHTEMAALRTLGDWLDGSGWSAALVQANVTSPGKAEAMLHASHVKRTRHAHQVTAACLYILQQRAYRQYVSSAPTAEPLEFSAWCDDQANCHPQFQYWSLTLQFQLIVLLHLKAIRQSNFQLYISSLTQLIPLFFALDHHHYARWASVHLRDMTALSTLHPDVAAEFESGRFTTHKSKRPFSAIALDQGHEQLNAHVKSVGGAVGLLDNSDALLRWMVAGPEVARIIGEFESSMSSKCETSDDLVHLEQTLSVQHKFSEQLKSLVNCFEEMGNPFLDETDVVSAIDTKNVCGPAVTETVRSVISRGREQHRLFTEERLISCTQAVTAPLARNRLALFRSSSAVAKRDVTKSKLTTVRNDCALFSRLYIACQTRDGNLEDFFTHENQPFPPSLSSGGELRFGTKSDLLTCLEKIAPSSQESPNVDTLVLDGAAVAQMLQPINCKTFEQYAVDIFLPYVRSQLHSVGRLDVIWDRYIAGSLKASARQKRGMGLRRHVLPSVAVPRNWAQFLHDSENKKELFSFLSSYVMADTNLPLSKHVFATDDCHVLCHPSTTQCSGLQPCSHEEADTRIMLHVAHAAQSGFNRVMIRTVDTDVVVLATALWYHLHLAELWVAFGTGRNYRYLPVHTLAVSLGVDRCMALPFFHAFTGCDAVSSFAGHGKKSAWDTWNSYPDCTETFKYLSLAPATITDCLPTLERFVTLLYERGSNKTSVNSARKHLFTKKGRSMEALPPTQAALVEHTKRAVYQAGYCWCRSLDLDQNLPCPSQWGWVKDTSVGEWTPLWTSLPEVSKCCPELVSCKCKKGCTKRCKCVKAALKCTSLCLCDGCTDA